jgi:hypothetical protein
MTPLIREIKYELIVLSTVANITSLPEVSRILRETNRIVPEKRFKSQAVSVIMASISFSTYTSNCAARYNRINILHAQNLILTVLLGNKHWPDSFSRW